MSCHFIFSIGLMNKTSACSETVNRLLGLYQNDNYCIITILKCSTFQRDENKVYTVVTWPLNCYKGLTYSYLK